MRSDVVECLERFFEDGFVWDDDALGELEGRLCALAPSPVAGLARSVAAVRSRLGAAPVAEPVRREIEAVLYPGGWKLLEAVRAGLPAGEQQARVDVLHGKLARLLAVGEPDPSPGL